MAAVALRVNLLLALVKTWKKNLSFPARGSVMHNFSFPGVGAASCGKLTFMVGGAEEEFTAAQELLSCMGANVVYCGQVGTGQVGAKMSYFPQLSVCHLD